VLKRGAVSFLILSAIFLAFLFFSEPGGVLFLEKKGGVVEAQEEIAVKKAITLYNRIFQDLYSSDGVPAMLNDFPASKQLRHEVFRHIGYLRERKLFMVIDMATQEFLGIKWPAPAKAEATVFEEWNYIYRDIGTRKITSSIKGMGQGYTYMLEKRPEGWIIVDYFPADVEMEASDEFKF